VNPTAKLPQTPPFSAKQHQTSQKNDKLKNRFKNQLVNKKFTRTIWLHKRTRSLYVKPHHKKQAQTKINQQKEGGIPRTGSQ